MNQDLTIFGAVISSRTSRSYTTPSRMTHFVLYYGLLEMFICFIVVGVIAGWMSHPRYDAVLMQATSILRCNLPLVLYMASSRSHKSFFGDQQSNISGTHTEYSAHAHPAFLHTIMNKFSEAKSTWRFIFCSAYTAVFFLSEIYPMTTLSSYPT